jgi:hypothetical protein
MKPQKAFSADPSGLVRHLVQQAWQRRRRERRGPKRRHEKLRAEVASLPWVRVRPRPQPSQRLQPQAQAQARPPGTARART